MKSPLLNTPSPKVKAYIQEAINLLKDKKKDEAYQLLLGHVETATKKDKISIFYAINDLFRKIDPTLAFEALDSIIEIDKKLTLPLMIKSKLYEELRQPDKAIQALKELMDRAPTNQELVEAARILSKYGQQESALKAAKDAYFGSGEDITLATYPLRVSLQNADWETADKITAKLLEAHRAKKTNQINETPRTHLLWCSDEIINQQVIENFSAKFKVSKKPPLRVVPEGDFNKRKVRIGYISNDFRDHPTSYLAMGMLRHHNKSRFEIYLYDTSYDDGSVMRRQVFSRSKLVRDLSKVSDEKAASIIFNDKIDILVDLNGLTDGTRVGIFSYRPAPVQISYLGFPGSSGSPFVDYIIADNYTLPKSSEEYYCESVIRIPSTYQINDFIAQYLPPLPTLSSLGLPEGKLIIGMFNNVNKVGREVWETWMQIMQKTPQTILWMLDPGELAKNNLIVAANKMGVDADRFYWAKKVSQEEHLARIRHCSIALDPWPYGGHTTTSDALFAGVPVVAIEGTNFPSRVSGGLLSAAGLKSLVAKSRDDYVKLATTLIDNQKLLSDIKKHLNNNRRRHPVFDSLSRTLYIEAAYLNACSLAAKKMKPASFDVNNRTKPKEGS